MKIRKTGFIIMVCAIMISLLSVNIKAYVIGETDLNADNMISLTASGQDITPKDRNNINYYLNFNKNKDISDSYELNYQTSLDATQIWKKYKSLSAVAGIFGYDIKRTKIDSSFVISTTFDKRLTIDTSKLDIEHTQKEFELKNNLLKDHLKVTNTSFDPSTGEYKINVDFNVTGRKLDQWDKDGTLNTGLKYIYFDVPTGAINLPASKFSTLLDESSLALVKNNLSGIMVINGNPEEALYVKNIYGINLKYDASKVKLNLKMANEEGNAAKLKVNKVVDGDKPKDNKSFEFTLKVNEKLFNGSYMVNGKKQSAKNGIILLKDKQTAVIDLKENDKFEIKEKNYKKQGYTTRYKGAIEGNMKLHQELISYTNTYKNDKDQEKEKVVNKKKNKNKDNNTIIAKTGSDIYTSVVVILSVLTLGISSRIMKSKK